MNLEEKLKLFKDKGWTYYPETGEIFSHTGKVIHGREGGGYIRCSLNIDNKRFSVRGHQLAWYLYHSEVPSLVDHKDRDKINNKINNLRLVTNQENSYNTNAKGYSWHKRIKKWQAKIRIKGGKRLHLGYFDLEEESRQAYLTSKEKQHIIGDK